MQTRISWSKRLHTVIVQIVFNNKTQEAVVRKRSAIGNILGADVSKAGVSTGTYTISSNYKRHRIER